MKHVEGELEPPLRRERKKTENERDPRGRNYCRGTCLHLAVPSRDGSKPFLQLVHILPPWHCSMPGLGQAMQVAHPAIVSSQWLTATHWPLPSPAFTYPVSHTLQNRLPPPVLTPALGRAGTQHLQQGRWLERRHQGQAACQPPHIRPHAASAMGALPCERPSAVLGTAELPGEGRHGCSR